MCRTSKKEAVKLLRDVIKFGSIQVYYKTNPEHDKRDGLRIGYKEVFRESSGFILDEKTNISHHVFELKKPISAIAPRE